MFTTLRAADIWVLEKIIEPLSWWLESVTKLNNFQQSRVLIPFHIVSSYMLSDISGDVNIFTIGVLLITYVYAFIHSKYLEYKSKNNVMSIARVNVMHLFLRGSVWILLIVTTFLAIYTAKKLLAIDESASAEVKNILDYIKNSFILVYINGFTALLYSYFLACSPRPPEYEHNLVYN